MTNSLESRYGFLWILDYTVCSIHQPSREYWLDISLYWYIILARNRTAGELVLLLNDRRQISAGNENAETKIRGDYEIWLIHKFANLQVDRCTT